MKRISWKWFLPLMQLILASAALVYGPPEYRARLWLDDVLGDNNVLEYFNQHFPAPVVRASYGINFPALVLDYPLMGYTKDLFHFSNDFTFINITPRGVGFFVGIAIFWYWVGRKLDQYLGRSPTIIRPRKTRVAGLTCGLVLGILTGAFAIEILIRDWNFRPERQIGAFGIVWSFVLIAYFAWQFTRELRASLQRAPV